MKRGLKGILSFLMALMICLGVFTLVGGVNTVNAEEDLSGSAYAVYQTSDQTLYFIRSESVVANDTTGTITNIGGRTFTGQIFAIDENKEITNASRPWYSLVSDVYKVQFVDVIKPKNTQAWFSGMKNCTEMDLKKLNTSDVVAMTWMFDGCSSITELDISHFDTKNVTNTGRMFADCAALKELNLSNFYTPNLTNNADLMFSGCRSLEILDISAMDTRNALNLGSMFSSCNKLKKVVLGNNFTFLNPRGSDAYLMTPPNGITTGQWIREDRMFGPYSPNALTENWNGQVMSGTWIWNMKPCAVFSEDGTLSFIRPTADSTYIPSSTGTVTSISGGTYTGTIFTVNETSTSTGNDTWSSIASQVKKVQFVDEIRPKNTSRWFRYFNNCVEMDLSKLNTKNVTTMEQMFYGCSSLTSLDLSMWDTSNLSSQYDMYYLFASCSSLKSLNLSGWDTSNVRSMCSTFESCSSLETLDLSSFDTSSVDDMREAMFRGCSNLKEIKLGEGFNFHGNNISSVIYQGVLHTPVGSEYTGKWIRDDKAYGPYTPAELRDNYTSKMAGTWVWELVPTEYTLSFAAGENGTGAMSNVTASSKEDFTLPANQFVAFGYDFDHWDDGNGKTYADKGTIPANAYAADKKVTLTAVWKKRDTSVSMENGEFEFQIRAGEKATFNDIPAGTSYQVYELTPDGWVLVQQENASGVIEALEESAASFWNRYQPGVTTVQFSGLKTLDGHPASEGSYKFELLENGKVIDTATTQDGGFIQFKVIEYDAAGDHTYTIREVEPDDDSVDYDTHEETVNVKVTDDGKGNLSSEVTYDEDGIKFENHTRPGILRITKNADVTEANKDDTFTFEIEFTNENGMPISDNIYWYVENGAEVSGE